MNRKLFYGADKVIQKPIFGFGNPSNDYGLAFYLTEEHDKAVLWASKNPGGGFVNEYRYDPEGLKILRLGCDKKEDILAWISLLVKNRFNYSLKTQYANNIRFLDDHFSIDARDYDVVVGYRADDSYFAYSRDFVKGDLSLESLSEAMKTGKLGFQTALISQKAFDSISFVEAVPYAGSNAYEILKQKTNEEYHTILSSQDDSMTFFRDITRSYGK